MGKRLKNKEKVIPALDVERYQGQWVALEPVSYRVLAHDFSLQKAEKRAHDKGITRPIMFSVPDSGSLFVGHGMILSRASRV